MRPVEKHILRAIEAGEFENLPGQGKPLHLDENPFEGEDWRLAMHLLRSNGFGLPWMESRKDIEESIRALREGLRRSWSWQRRLRAQRAAPPSRLDSEFERAVAAFRRRVTELNRQIRDYNLQAPSSHFHLAPLQADKEIQTIITAE